MTNDDLTTRFSADPEQLLRTNLSAVEDRIAAACARAGRPRTSVTLLPVTKTVPSEILRLAFKAGLSVMAENKVQEAQSKAADMAALAVTWSVIGHLQTNKVKPMLTFASEFQALDSLRLARLINDHLIQLDTTLDVYVQVNTSGEASKYGIAPGDADAFVAELQAFPALKPRGLMTLAILKGQPDDVRACFRRLRHLRDRLVAASPRCGLERLSMGMTSDFEMAIEEGADVVRIGQAIFGRRPTKDGHFWPGLLP
jgi:PLP dependent protein